jgi:5-methylcytosine-specific restriction endonuclease McrA
MTSNLFWKRLIARGRGFNCERCGTPLQVMLSFYTREIEGYPNGKTAYLHHKDKNQRNTLFDNLELLCSKCHGGLHVRERMAIRRLGVKK